LIFYYYQIFKILKGLIKNFFLASPLAKPKAWLKQKNQKYGHKIFETIEIKPTQVKKSLPSIYDYKQEWQFSVERFSQTFYVKIWDFCTFKCLSFNAVLLNVGHWKNYQCHKSHCQKVGEYMYLPSYFYGRCMQIAKFSWFVVLLSQIDVCASKIFEIKL